MTSEQSNTCSRLETGTRRPYSSKPGLRDANASLAVPVMAAQPAPCRGIVWRGDPEASGVYCSRSRPRLSREGAREKMKDLRRTSPSRAIARRVLRRRRDQRGRGAPGELRPDGVRDRPICVPVAADAVFVFPFACFGFGSPPGRTLDFLVASPSSCVSHRWLV